MWKERAGEIGRGKWARWKRGVSEAEKESEWGGKGKGVKWKKNVGWVEKESITRAFAHE